jgi:YidC/Oxa1 family membrane protein insertase
MLKGMPKMDASNNMMLQQQKIMLYVFPVIFAISGVNFPVGVLIYWSTTNLWTFGQQFYVIKRNPTPGSPAYEELQKKKLAKGGTTPEISGTDALGAIESEGSNSGNSPRQRQQPKAKPAAKKSTKKRK